MNAEKLNQELYDKMTAEQKEYRSWLVEQTPEEILNHAFEYSAREDILMAITVLTLPAQQAAALLTSPSPLADIYKDFRNTETNQMEVVVDCIEGRAERLIEKQREAIRSIPLYQQPGEYAREHGELDAFRASYQANVACKEAIEAAIRAGFDGMHLTTDPKEILAEFGPERVTFVLAATIQSKGWDERFSRSNKAWAAAVPMFDREDRRRPYIVHIHTTVVNGFVDMVRKELAAMRDQPGQTAEKPSIRGQLAAAKAVQAEKPAAQQRQKDKEAR
ncbi:DUF3849 domain-containing protein [Pseudoflavonifractor sp. 60]|uniref:DUF3849 domain-containing protein n=1 Tax=Pseudoflavonifractor sp. 60 TaxID=2304576 RepID=UPI001369478B|nr:DUF3849 domain-containing protein [Pseudoflavonifractor sp. 60]NBI68701.1 DUF3849 domain-containing protein [Pseudoflavonifractor sp. 60]